MTAMLPGAFAKAPIETRFEDTLVSAHRVASARRTSSRRCSAAMPDRAPEVRLRLDRLTAMRGGQGPHRRRRGEPLLPLAGRRPLPLRRFPRTGKSLHRCIIQLGSRSRSVEGFTSSPPFISSSLRGPVPATLSPDGGTPSSLGFGSCLLSFALSGFWVGVSRCCFFPRVRIPAFPRPFGRYYG